MPAPVLLFGYGNPSRGDDALGPALLERIDALRARHPEWPEIDLLTDFQLQVEHALDLAGRSQVLFVDADVAAGAPFSYRRIHPGGAPAYSTHMLTPQVLLGVFRQVVGAEVPPAYLLGIRGEHFELGAPLSAAAANHLKQAVDFTAGLLAQPDPLQWAACVDA